MRGRREEEEGAAGETPEEASPAGPSILGLQPPEREKLSVCCCGAGLRWNAPATFCVSWGGLRDGKNGTAGKAEKAAPLPAWGCRDERGVHQLGPRSLRDGPGSSMSCERPSSLCTWAPV